MVSTGHSAWRGEGRLWAISLGLSVLVNAAIMLMAFASIRSEMLRRQKPVTAAPPTESVVTIFPEVAAAKADSTSPAAAPEPAPTKPRFARTSDDQTSPPPKGPAFIGERDTTATSDRTPNPTAPDLPSQKGEQPKDEDDLETTESNYRDGKLAANRPPPPPPPPGTPPPPPAASRPDPAAADPIVAEQPAPAAEKSDQPPGMTPSQPASPPPGELLAGPNPVDVPVLKPTEKKDGPKPTPLDRPGDDSPACSKPAELPKPPPVPPANDPAFAGNQKKAAIVGSISRTGRSALNVADTPLGRYQAIISRAVELEWQRNCVRHRDFITPGYLTVRFYVEPNGKVRTVQFVGQMETGEVQKGFTLNSIRDAEIPAMPAALRKEYEKSPLELIFNFYF